MAPVENLTVRYGGVTSLDGLTLTFEDVVYAPPGGGWRGFETVDYRSELGSDLFFGDFDCNSETN